MLWTGAGPRVPMSASGHGQRRVNSVPRRHHRREDAAPDVDATRVRRGVEATQSWTDGDWRVRVVAGEATTKAYRCPGCDQEIRPGTAHVVAWPADERGDLG